MEKKKHLNSTLRRKSIQIELDVLLNNLVADAHDDMEWDNSRNVEESKQKIRELFNKLLV